MGSAQGFLCRLCGEPLPGHPRCACGALLGRNHAAGKGWTHISGLWACRVHIDAPLHGFLDLKAAASGEDCPICGALAEGHRRCAICTCFLGEARDAEGRLIAVVEEPPEVYPARHDGGAGHAVGKHWVCNDHYTPGMTPKQIQQLKLADRIRKAAYHKPTDEEGNVLPPSPDLDAVPEGGVLVADLARALKVRPEMIRKRLRAANLRPMGVVTLAPGVRAFVYAAADLAPVVRLWRK